MIPTPGFNKLVQCRSGLMLCNRNDQYVGRSLIEYGEFSKGETDLFRAILKPGMKVIDVGANIGALTVPIAQIVGPDGVVIAYEPQRLVFQTLCANIALNSLQNVDCIHAAAGADGYMNVAEPDPDRRQNFGGIPLKEHGDNDTYTVRSERITGHCDFIKIDAEGMEADVIRGALETLETIGEQRPIIYCENDRDEKAAELLTLLHDLEYQMWEHEPPLYSPDNFRGKRDDVFAGVVSKNILALPKEKYADLTGLIPLRIQARLDTLNRIRVVGSK